MCVCLYIYRTYSMLNVNNYERNIIVLNLNREQNNTSNYFNQKWLKQLDANCAFMHHFYSTVYFFFMLCSSNLQHNQLSTCLDNSCSLSPSQPLYISAPRGQTVDIWVQLPGAVWLVEQPSGGLCAFVCAQSLCCLHPRANGPPQQWRTRRTLVGKPLIRDSERLYSQPLPADKGTLLASHSGKRKFKVD